MRTIFATFVLSAAAVAQVDQQPPATPSPASDEPLVISTAPLAPPDLDSPYASPRDAARQWFQTTLANLVEQRDTRAAIRGFAQAFLVDRTYGEAAFNIGVIAAIE